jgi:DNA-binding NtrC family response regulator
MLKVLLVDDDRPLHETFDLVLSDRCMLVSAFTGADGLAAFERDPPDVVLLDIDLPDLDGVAVLHRMVARPFPPPIIMLTALTDVRLVKECILAGAYDYIAKPCDLAELEGTLRRAAAQAAARRARAVGVDETEVFAGLAGETPAMHDVKRLVLRYAASDSAVVVLGESGTGKELVARSLHHASHRASGPFVAVNCGAIPDGLAETELFGAERGAYTDAVSRPGSFERAGGGTIFLDEVGELSGRAQTGLLRVIEQKEVQRVGGARPVPLDVRVVSATNRDLKAAVRRGTFREDLYWRLAVLPIRLPALRERLADLPLVAAALLDGLGGDEVRLTDDALERLAGHSWPGNVRELRNVLERALLAARDGRIRAGDLAFDEWPRAEAAATGSA